MASAKPALKTRRPKKPKHELAHERAPGRKLRAGTELVIITGMSGSGKASVLKVFEDLGYYCVDNMPVDLIPSFAELVSQSPETHRAALVVDVREGTGFDKLPAMLKAIKKILPAKVIYLEANDEVLMRRYSETRRPHPLGSHSPVRASLKAERKRLGPISTLADELIDTSKFNVHELRSYINDRFRHESKQNNIMVSVVSFGFREGVPEDADLVFDVRFLPNPHFIPEFRPLTGRHPKVAKYIRSFPQTQESLNRISDLLTFLLPHYVKEGKSYLTIGIGCTGGQHRSVMITEELAKRLRKAGYAAKTVHRDSPK